MKEGKKKSLSVFASGGEKTQFILFGLLMFLYFTTLGALPAHAQDVCYVADWVNNRIQKFDSDGAYLLQWGGFGAGDGQFNKCYGIAVDSGGDVYVTDLNNFRIQKFDSDGTYLTQWGSYGDGDGQFYKAHDIAVDSSDNIYVADKGDHRVQKFDSDGTYLAQWGSLGTGDGQFDKPCGIAVDSSDNVYVADLNNSRIQKFDVNGTYLAQWGSPGTGDGQFNSPHDIAVDSSDNIYVTDKSELLCRVQNFDSDGTYLAQWGSPGTGDGQFNSPNGIAVDSSDNVYVADMNNNRIQKFDSDGTYLTQWGSYGDGDGQFYKGHDIAIFSAATAPADLVINEVMYDPEGDEAEGEWVEIYVVSGGIDVGGYVLTDQDGYSVTFPSFTPQNGEYIIVANGVGDDDLVGPVYVIYRDSGSSMWTNTGDDVVLQTGSGECIDYMAFEGPGQIDAPPVGCSWSGTPNPSSSEGVSVSLEANGQDMDDVSDWAASGTGGTLGPQSRGGDNNGGLSWVSDCTIPVKECSGCVPAQAPGYPRYTDHYYEDYVTIKNTSGSELSLPIQVVLQTLEPGSISASTPPAVGDGYAPGTYWEYSSSVHDGKTSGVTGSSFPSGERISRIWKFNDPSDLPFSFWAEVYCVGSKGDRWLGRLEFSSRLGSEGTVARRGEEDLAVDDGTAEIHAGSTTGAFVMANRFATVGPVSLRSVSFYTSGWAAGDEAEVIIYEDPAGTAPGPDTWMEVWRTTVELGSGGFQEMSTEGCPTINSDGIPGAAFFAAVANKAERSYTLGIDMSGPYAGASYVSDDGGLTFAPLSIMPIIDGNAMIRVSTMEVGACFIWTIE